MPTESSPHPSGRPLGVVLIVAVLILEAIALLVLAVGLAATVLRADALSVGSTAFLAVLMLLVAAALGAMARKLAVGFRWPRSPSLVVQIFLVILAFPYFTEGDPLVGLLLMIPAAAVIVALFSKRVVEFTVRPTGSGRTL